MLPPEINSGRMYAGPGSGPLLAAAATWDGLADELHSAAVSFEVEIANLTGGPWLGAASASMSAAAADHIAWLNTAAGEAEQTAAQARAAAGAFEAAFSLTVPPPVIASNRSLLTALVATNLVGQNTAAIATTEAQYAQMWAQDATAMYGYAAASAVAATLTPFNPPAPVANPEQAARQPGLAARATGTWVATNAQTTLSQLTSRVPAALQSTTSSLPFASTSAGSEVGGIAQSLGLTNPFNLLGPTNTVMSTVGLNNAYAASISSAEARSAIMNVGYEISGKEDQILSRFGQSGPLRGPADLGSGAGLVTASAGLGQSGSVGGLSVPQGWAVGAPAMRATTLPLPIGSLNTATDGLADSTGRLLSELALVTTTVVRGIDGAAVSQRRWAQVLATNRADAPMPQTSSVGPPTGIADELGKLAALRDAGILTDGEFTRQKRRLLGE